MRHKIIPYSLVLIAFLILFSSLIVRMPVHSGKAMQAITEGLISDPARAGTVRAQKDTVGYATNPSQVDVMVRIVDSLESSRYEANEKAFPALRKKPLIGAIIPHDDYLYAGRGYVHAIRFVRAKCAVLCGVSHTARRRGVQGKLILDTYDAWRVGGVECRVSPIRDEIRDALPGDLVLVSDEMHAEEHSLEGFVPVLKHFVPDLEIVPILVTRFEREKRIQAADTLASILSKLAEKRGWSLGRDFVIIVSADCVHYGDDEWGGRNYAPFGVDSMGFERAVAQDLDIVQRALTGRVDEEKISLFGDLVDSGDFQNPYKITWCGVYSIPFGLSALERLCSLAGREAPEGFMLIYGTSIDPPKLELQWTGLGTTAIATLRHWVGYTAVGYW